MSNLISTVNIMAAFDQFNIYKHQLKNYIFSQSIYLSFKHSDEDNLSVDIKIITCHAALVQLDEIVEMR